MIKSRVQAEHIPPLRTWTARDIAEGTRVLLRVDANVAVPHGRAATGPHGRIARSLPEVRRLLKRRARVVLLTHLGNPNGSDARFSVAPIARAYAALLGMPVAVARDVVGPDAHRRAGALAPGEVMMVENVRFETGEKQNDTRFARRLASLADVYVNNAFGVCHRSHASVVAVAKHSPAFAGELLVREVGALMQPFEKPFVLVVGGVKLATKLPLLIRLGVQADRVLLGSALADELLRSRALAAQLEDALGDRLLLPPDCRRDADHHAYDVGPRTEALFATVFADAHTIVWNGPFGVIERKEGRKGTRALLRAMLAAPHARTVVGGGETLDAIAAEGAEDAFSWVSTGGGAMLALLAGEFLPALDLLRPAPTARG